MDACFAGLIVEYAPSPPGQILRPTATVTVGSWSDQSGGTTDLATPIAESIADDATYIQSPLAPNNEETKLRLTLGAPTPFPRTAGSHVVNIRAKKDTTGGFNIDLTATLYLSDGTTVVATRTWTNIDPTTTQQISLTQAEAESIPDVDWGSGLMLGLKAFQH
jgi:hypothetical protein